MRGIYTVHILIKGTPNFTAKNPFFQRIEPNSSAETPESIESALLEIKKLYKSDGESDAGSEQIQSWLDEAQKLHDAWANVINQVN